MYVCACVCFMFKKCRVLTNVCTALCASGTPRERQCYRETGVSVCVYVRACMCFNLKGNRCVCVCTCVRVCVLAFRETGVSVCVYVHVCVYVF